MGGFILLPRSCSRTDALAKLSCTSKQPHMDRLFGKAKPAAPKPTLQDASSSLEARGETLDTKIMKLDKELARYTEQLKKMKPGPAKATVQKRAMVILKQKKLYEGQKEQTMNQQFNMDQIMFTQETLKDTASTVSAMKDANKDLKKQFKQIKINQIEDLTDDMADLLEQAEEVQVGRRRAAPCPTSPVAPSAPLSSSQVFPPSRSALRSHTPRRRRAARPPRRSSAQPPAAVRHSSAPLPPPPQNALGRSYNTDDIDEADLEAELAAMEDDPSLFLSSAGDESASADYLDLPATSTAPVESGEAAALPAATPEAATA